MPAERVVKFLKNLRLQIQNQPKQDIVDEYFLKEIQYAEHEINTRNLYTTSVGIKNLMAHRRELGHKFSRDKNNKKAGRMSMRLQWLNEFSDIGNELLSSDTLQVLKGSSAHLNYSAQYNSSDNDVDSIIGIPSNSSVCLTLKKKQTCMVKMVDLNDYQDLLADFYTREFNIMAFA